MAEARMFYQEDCNLSLLDGKTIAVIGYGSQGHAHALNAKESGCNVIIGLYEGSKSWAKAQAQGFQVYTAAEAATMPEKIDLVYFFESYTLAEVEGYDQGVAFNHAFVAPAADAEKFLPDIKLPAGVNRNTKIRDVGIKDAHLARLHLKDSPEAQPAIFIDDIDLRDMDMSTMPNYALDLITNDGMFIETQDGKYKAYIYVNSARTGRVGATISMKRYTMY